MKELEEEEAVRVAAGDEFDESVLTEKGDSGLKAFDNPNRILIKSDDTIVAEINRQIPNQDDVDNAKLIAAAPELLECLNHVKYCLETNQPMGELTLTDITKVINKALK